MRDGLLQGKVALITGSSRGIGAATALLFAREGAQVIVNYRAKQEAAERVVKQIVSEGGQAVALRADVSKMEEVVRLVDEATAKVSLPDILVNNAAIVYGLRMLETEPETWHETFNTNIHGCYYCTRTWAKRKIAAGGPGVIVNVSSVCGPLAVGQRAAYAATKGAIESFTRECARELAPYGIRVNACAPGATNTEINLPFYTPEVKAFYHSRVALARIAEPDEIAKALLFLASDLSSYLCGTVLMADGGYLACDGADKG